MKHLLLCICLFAFSSLKAQLLVTGIPSGRLVESFAFQANSQWCWAASIEMVLEYYGVEISQEEIVRRSYGTDPFGNLPNWSGTFNIITVNLNYFGTDTTGMRYRVSSSYGVGAPWPATLLLNELNQQKPVIVGYNTGFSGHAVVVTAASYYNDFIYGTVVNSIIVRDPWPDTTGLITGGRKEYLASSFASQMMAHWFIDVELLGRLRITDNAIFLGSNWYYLDWLGSFVVPVAESGWMYHQDLGWNFVIPTEGGDYWFYNLLQGWLYATPSYPEWFFSIGSNRWSYFPLRL